MSFSILTSGPDRQHVKHVGMFCLLMMALSGIGWICLDKLISIQAVESQIESTLGLEQRVSQLRSQYEQANPAILESELNKANQRLVKNYSELTQWVEGVREHGQDRDLDMEYRILKAEGNTGPLKGIRLIPLELHLYPHNDHSGYQPFLEMLHDLTQSNPRVDIQDITVMGDGGKATHMKLGLLVWMKTRDSVEL